MHAIKLSAKVIVKLYVNYMCGGNDSNEFIKYAYNFVLSLSFSKIFSMIFIYFPFSE